MRTGRGAVVGAVIVVVLAGACSGAKRDVASPPTSTTTTATSAPAPDPTPTTAAPRPEPSGPYALTSFGSCSSLLRHLKREGVKAVTPWGLPASGNGRMMRGGAVTLESTAGASADVAASAPASGAGSGGAGSGSSYSGTNIQESGVDEPDLVKTDGRRLVTVGGGKLKIVDLAPRVPAVIGTMDLPRMDAAPELLLAGDRVLLFWQSFDERQSSHVRIIDIANPAKPAEVASMRLDGSYVSARLAAGVVRLVLTHDPKGPALKLPQNGYDSGAEEAELVQSHRNAIRQSKIEDWLPTYDVTRPGAKPVSSPLVPCASVLRPKEFAGLAAVSVLTIDPADPKPASVACVLGGGRIVYASPQNLYVATERWTQQPWESWRAVGPGGAVADSSGVPAAVPSQIHQFAIPGRDPAVYVGSGQIEGSLLNQFSMSEHDGHLRVAATIRRGAVTDNLVYTLGAKDGRLVELGKLGGLGHEGETIHSVRFLGTRGYVVTFRQTDPLYVLDLRDPQRPKKLGELQVPGFSSYLHPLSDTALLGVGRGPDDRGGQGLQVSLFDVGDPARPVRLANEVFPGGSPAQEDHHAFLWWPQAGKLVLPYITYDYSSGTPDNGTLVLPVDPAKGFGAHKVLESAGQVSRTLVSDGRLLALTEFGIKSYDVGTLDALSTVSW